MKKQILDTYYYKLELHAHTTPASPCSDILTKDIAPIYEKAGYNAIAIVNHFDKNLLKGDTVEEQIENYIRDYKVVKENATSINVIFGIEARFADGENDYLVFGIDENDLYDIIPYLYGDYETFYKEYKNDTNIIIQAHPFRNGMTLRYDVDGIESVNLHPKHNSRVGVAMKYASENNILQVCGSDFHHYGDEAVSAMRFKEEVTDSFKLAKLIKNKEYVFEFSSNIMLP